MILTTSLFDDVRERIRVGGACINPLAVAVAWKEGLSAGNDGDDAIVPVILLLLLRVFRMPRRGDAVGDVAASAGEEVARPDGDCGGEDEMDVTIAPTQNALTAVRCTGYAYVRVVVDDINGDVAADDDGN